MSIEPKKKAKLQQIRDQLLDVYIEEADPNNWTTKESAEAEAEEFLIGKEGDKSAAKEAKEIRNSWKGQRYWEKKNANQTAVMILKLDQILEDRGEGEGAGGEEKETAKEIRAYEKEAKKRLARSRPELRRIEGGKK